jgi:hypothetical protein
MRTFVLILFALLMVPLVPGVAAAGKKEHPKIQDLKHKLKMKKAAKGDHGALKHTHGRHKH